MEDGLNHQWPEPRTPVKTTDIMDPQLFCLRWNNHQTNLLSVFDQLLQVEAFCDVTLAVDGASIKCHKMVLAACSNYFQSLFMENTCKHPIVFLKDIRFVQMRALLDYMYHGEVSVEEAELPQLLKIAEALKVKGLVESEDERATASSREERATASSKTSSPVKPKAPSRTSGSGIWPVSTSKLLSPTTKGPREPTEEDPGHLVIDEESYETNGCTTMSPLDVDYDMNYLNEETPPAPGMVKTIGANGKVEWKRYKQYTKDDILAAIEEVKNGMSALQASRKYGVPSRTLYDKVKKMGILTANMQKQLNQKKDKDPDPNVKNGSPNYPPINMLGLQLPQSSLPLLDKEGKPAPPLSGAMMMSMLERMKLIQGNTGLKHLPSGPLNLSAMLDAAPGGSEDDSQRSSESNRSSEDSEPREAVKQEDSGETDSIRAQFFAQLASTASSGPEPSAATSVIRQVHSAESKSITLAPREEQPASPPSSLPPRKRKYSQGEQEQVEREQEEEDRWRRRREEEERDKPVEAGPC